MKDLGTKQSKMFPSAVEDKKDEVRYPNFDLPLSVIEGMGCKMDDEVDVHIKGRISGMQDTKWSKCVTIEAKEGEITKAGRAKAKSSSIMDENK